jgi:hypothetical protein
VDAFLKQNSYFLFVGCVFMYCFIRAWCIICVYQELLAAVDERPWISLSKRRVQHYGYEFCYGVSIHC